MIIKKSMLGWWQISFTPLRTLHKISEEHQCALLISFPRSATVPSVMAPCGRELTGNRLGVKQFLPSAVASSQPQLPPPGTRPATIHRVCLPPLSHDSRSDCGLISALHNSHAHMNWRSKFSSCWHQEIKRQVIAGRVTSRPTPVWFISDECNESSSDGVIRSAAPEAGSGVSEGPEGAN